jgi:hypothetical protein
MTRTQRALEPNANAVDGILLLVQSRTASWHLFAVRRPFPGAGSRLSPGPLVSNGTRNTKVDLCAQAEPSPDLQPSDIHRVHGASNRGC